MKFDIDIKFLSLGLMMLLILSSCEEEGPPIVDSFTPDSGFEKTLITVEGSNFENLVSINFNEGIPADFNPSFGTSSALLFRVPENAPLGQNNVVITTETGEVSFPFTVTLEAPAISDFNPKSANEGEMVYIIGKNFFEPLVVLFEDSLAGNIIYSDPDSLVVEVPPGVERGRIKVKANGGFSLTGEFFFSTTELLVNDFDGNGVRSETDKWLFYGSINENASTAIFDTDPIGVDGTQFMKISGTDPGSIWIGGAESHSNDPMVFDVFDIESNINNTFVEMDINNNGYDKTHLILVLAERGGSPNDFSETIEVDWDGWKHVSIPLNRFKDVDGAFINPEKIRTIKMHLYNELQTNQPLEVNVDNLKFVQIN